ncbi:MAG: hypothetical protein Q7T74_04515 [Candidatus Saccharibacteria bacterium]|nr:hypothetical protein [Candidatus Saccharibacteria bacterium]
MALYVNRDEKRSQYQEKIAADLKGKLKTTDIQAEKVESTMLEGVHQTRTAGLVIAGLLLLVVIVAVIVMFKNG